MTTTCTATGIKTPWDRVRAALEKAEAITTDGCHKIYVLLDNETVEDTLRHGYDEDAEFFVTRDEQPRRRCWRRCAGGTTPRASCGSSAESRTAATTVATSPT